MNPIAVVADIHGNFLALQAVMTDLERRGITRVLNLGDHCSGPLWPKDTADLLMKQNWTHIRGNHDRYLISQRPEQMGASDRYAFDRLDAVHLQWLESLPATLEVEPSLFLCHATPLRDDIYLLETIGHGTANLAHISEIQERLGGIKASLLLCGHTHIPRLIDVGEVRVLNPGSLGLPAYDDTDPEPHVMQVGSTHTRYAVLNRGEVGWSVELVALEYDHMSAAKQARANGREDWAVALETGYANQR